MQRSISHSRPSISLGDVLEVSRQALSGRVGRGPRVEELELRLRQMYSCEYAVAVPSGTVGLVAALRLVGVNPGDEVIVPTWTCPAVAEAAISIAARPIFADVLPNGTLDVEKVKTLVSGRTRAIIAVHAIGNLADVEKLKQLGLPVIEDSSQALGVRNQAGMVGSRGSIGVISLEATKTITSGEGGFLLTNSSSYFSKLTSLQGTIGVMSDLTAALAVSQLRRLPRLQTKRARITNRYREVIAGSAVTVLNDQSNRAPYRFMILSDHGFEKTKDFFAHRGITVRRGIDSLLHRNHHQGDGDFPNGADLFSRAASIPNYPALNWSQVRRIAAALADFARLEM